MRSVRFKWGSSEEGFSLIELMIVVGILGVLATLAVPRFKQFQIKAKMAEARKMIQYMSNLEHAYHLAQNTFIDFGPLGAAPATMSGGNLCDASLDAGATALGFAIDGCVSNGPIPRYYFRVTGASGNRFVASGGTGNLAFNRVCQGNDHHWLGVNQDKIVMGEYQSNNPRNDPTLSDLTVRTACPNY